GGPARAAAEEPPSDGDTPPPPDTPAPAAVMEPAVDQHDAASFDLAPVMADLPTDAPAAVNDAASPDTPTTTTRAEPTTIMDDPSPADPDLATVTATLPTAGATNMAAAPPASATVATPATMLDAEPATAAALTPTPGPTLTTPIATADLPLGDGMHPSTTQAGLTIARKPGHLPAPTAATATPARVVAALATEPPEVLRLRLFLARMQPQPTQPHADAAAWHRLTPLLLRLQERLRGETPPTRPEKPPLPFWSLRRSSPQVPLLAFLRRVEAHGRRQATMQAKVTP
ncbi:MAG: hypothetical protein HQL66_15225, partial [Magnetococcales bacterium]|nr:hypothetical protein [Magnetococcales bacterium]